MSTPVEPYIWPLNPIQYPGLTVCFQIFTFVLIDLLSPVKWQAYRVPGDQGVGLMCRKGSRGRPTGSQGVKGWAYQVPGNQGSGLQGPSVFLLVQENEDDHLQQQMQTAKLLKDKSKSTSHIVKEQMQMFCAVLVCGIWHFCNDSTLS